MILISTSDLNLVIFLLIHSVVNNIKLCDPNNPHMAIPTFGVEKILTEITYLNCYYS